jgi:CheY-like chemotaxis protein
MVFMELKPKILVVEDESIIAMNLRVTIARIGYEVTSVVNNALAAIQKTEQNKPDVILMDIMLGGSLDGIEAAKTISYNTPLKTPPCLIFIPLYLHA